VRLRRIPPSIAIVTVLALTLSMGDAHAGGFSPQRARGKMLHLVNHYRAQHGEHRLRMSRDIVRIAQRHSRRMATARSLFHTQHMWTKLRSYKVSCWGENVGMAPSVWGVFRGWVRSSDHRANMLNRRFRRTGVGVVRAHGVLWITMIYYG
jgi:uncharacterized protein YkwD